MSRRYVNEQLFNQSHKVSVRGSWERQQLNCSDRNLSPNCHNCMAMQRRLLELEQENRKLRENQVKCEQESAKLQKLCLQIARTKQKMAKKILSKQQQLLSIMNLCGDDMPQVKRDASEDRMYVRSTSGGRLHGIKTESTGF